MKKQCRLAVGIKFKRQGRFIRLVSLVAVDICMSLICCMYKNIYIYIYMNMLRYTYIYHHIHI